MTRGKLIRPVILGMALMLLFVFAGSTFIVKKNKDTYFRNQVDKALDYASKTKYPTAYRNYLFEKNASSSVSAVSDNQYRFKLVYITRSEEHNV